jgi:hypothetical protein
MKIISFDVGIKNMAYCIFDISGAQLSIEGWNVINLLEEETSNEVCSQIIPGKTKKVLPKPCTKIAKYKKNEKHYCEKHAKSSQFIIPNKKNSITQLKKLKVDELTKLYISIFFTESPKLKKDILEKILEYYEKTSFEPIIKKKSKNASDTDLITVGKNMKELLNNVEKIDDVTHVLIENQISPIANRMKTLQGMLAQYFIMKNSDIHIDFVSSANKLKNFKPLENTLIENNESGYKKNKKDGVQYCQQLLDSNPGLKKWESSLNTKKKDDLADCFLQGMWYIQKNINIKYND